MFSGMFHTYWYSVESESAGEEHGRFPLSPYRADPRNTGAIHQVPASQRSTTIDSGVSSHRSSAPRVTGKMASTQNVPLEFIPIYAAINKAVKREGIRN
ncbi:hypothetical protein SAMN00790413_04584 [Deinococcus hopiensis KR-140]|uniref:Uncharacterized protein n=1 Tax=Deinococcus hopiensis KR-140 TaxID=695939 RepID=A0A1W1UK22_9DEIO|nr:hypothetical protein SAMN00790413_04584 [Deinococcus hopiensis KR-140]